MSRNKRQDDAVYNNIVTEKLYERRLINISISEWGWDGFPTSVNTRYLERGLTFDGAMILFKDPVMNEYIALKLKKTGDLDIYGDPITRRAYGNNGYVFPGPSDNIVLDETNSVIIYNDLMKNPSIPDIRFYAKKLAEIDRTIDINISAQKTPIIIRCEEDMRTSLLNAYQQYDSGVPVIFGDKKFSENMMQAFTTAAPYVADRLQLQKSNIWNEAMTALGIPNISIMKKERLISDEVERSQGGVLACRNSRELARQEAVEKIHKVFPELSGVTCTHTTEINKDKGGENNGSVYNNPSRDM